MNSIANRIISPYMSEKAMTGADQRRQFVFRVQKTANKQQIKKAIEALFKVEVLSVNTVRVKGKSTTFRNKKGHHANWKKAYITLAEGHDIELVSPE